ncbi:MAG: hypothetical protein QOJ54_1181, partial [Aliidongia sp.]|nr:hypothetical protein [Aliidongia sp.]
MALEEIDAQAAFFFLAVAFFLADVLVVL